METIRWAVEFVRHLQDHLNDLIGWTGLPVFYAVMFLVIFCETGLVVTPFLPGDSLLFALGAMAASPASGLSPVVLFVLLLIAAVVGDAVNYAIGWRIGPKVFRYEGSWLLNKKHLLRAQEFYEKYGSKTIILARFVPIVRTFAPFVAGIGTMRYRRFAIYNVVGGAAWVAICLFGGYWFGQIPIVKNNFEIVLVAIVLISVLPMAVELVLESRRRLVPKPADALVATAPTAPASADHRVTPTASGAGQGSYN
jgi:membrane-associated protein